MNPVVFSTGFFACRRYIFGSCRRRSTWFDDLRFCVYESCARSWTQKRNYTRKDFFRNRVYENYAPKLDSGEKLYMEGLFRKSCLWKSKSDADFHCQAPIKYTRFQNENVHVYFTCRFSISGRKSIYTIFEKSISCPVVTVRARRCLHPRLIFYETPMPSVSFCLFAHPIRPPLSICISVPPRANKKIDDFFFACGCRAGILLDFQTIIARGPEIFTGEPSEIDEDGWHYPITSCFRNRGYF